MGRTVGTDCRRKLLTIERKCQFETFNTFTSSILFTVCQNLVRENLKNLDLMTRYDSALHPSLTYKGSRFRSDHISQRRNTLVLTPVAPGGPSQVWRYVNVVSGQSVRRQQVDVCCAT